MSSEASTVEGRVLRIAGGSYQVELDDDVDGEAGGDVVPCVLAGRLKQEGEARVAVGDRVRVERLDDGPDRIAEILPRRSKLARRAAESESEQIIAVNLDQVAAVFSVDRPEPDLAMLDRMLVLAELNGLAAFVVANKTDLGPPDAFDLYGDAGYDVLPTSAEEETGLEALRRRLEDRVSVFAGPSGAGKSSLLNAVLPGLERRVGEVSGAGGGRGRHTTVNATLLPLPDGGYVADTPGLQYLTLWRMPPDEMAAAFPEFRPMLGACRFNDCRHLQEPGCAIRDALERGEVSERRYRSYAALLEEAEEQSRPW